MILVYYIYSASLEPWKLRAQLVFGSIESLAGEKTFIENSERFKRFN